MLTATYPEICNLICLINVTVLSLFLWIGYLNVFDSGLSVNAGFK